MGILDLQEIAEMPAGAIIINLHKGIVIGDKFIEAMHKHINVRPKVAIYIELTNVTDTIHRSSSRKHILDGLVDFVADIYKMTDYDHKAVQVKPEVNFVSPSTLIEFKKNHGVITKGL